MICKGCGGLIGANGPTGYVGHLCICWFKQPQITLATQNNIENLYKEIKSLEERNAILVKHRVIMIEALIDICNLYDCLDGSIGKRAQETASEALKKAGVE